MGLIAWAILGLLAGFIAKFFMSDFRDISLGKTVILGIAGAYIGGSLSVFFKLGAVTGVNFQSIIISALGAILILYLYKKLRK